MASLESLSNPLERTGVLPQGMNANSDPATGSLVWDIDRQYFKNDVATSAVDGGAYIYTGATTTIRGGTDPSQDPANWTKTFPNGVSSFTSVVPTTADGGAGVITITNGVVVAPENSVWLCVLQGQGTIGANFGAGDVSTYTFTGSAGGSAQSVSWLPFVGSTTTNWATSTVITVGNAAGAKTITLSGAYAGTFAATTLKWTLIRLF